MPSGRSPNNSLLILTFDEDDSAHGNHVLTFFYGAGVVQGDYSRYVDHFDVLRTVEDIYGLGYAGASANASPLTEIFAAPEPATWLLLTLGVAATVLAGRWKVIPENQKHGS